MRKIKDRILLGVVSGITASIIGHTVNIIEHKAKKIDPPYSLVPSKIFFDKNKDEDLTAQVTAVIANLIMASVVSTITAYTLSLTGKDKAILKGAGIWSIFWVTLAGVFYNTVLGVKPKNTKIPLLSLADHILMGTITSLIIVKLGDSRLFPDKKMTYRRKIPIFNLGYSEKSRH